MKDHFEKQRKENTCIFQQQRNRVALVSHVFSMKQCLLYLNRINRHYIIDSKTKSNSYPSFNIRNNT